MTVIFLDFNGHNDQFPNCPTKQFILFTLSQQSHQAPQIHHPVGK